MNGEHEPNLLLEKNEIAGWFHMAANVIMPKLGMNMKEGTVVEWLRHEREKVKKGDPIAVISSDKIEKEIEAPEDGILLKINAHENDVVPIGTTIAIVGTSVENVNEPFTVENVEKEEPVEEEAVYSEVKMVNRLAPNLKLSEKEESKKIRISPSAKSLAESLGVNIEKINGTGPNGRITNKDIRDAAVRMNKPEEKEIPPQENIEELKDDIEPLVGMRRTIADRLTGSLHNTAQLTITMKADITELQKVRKALNEQCEKDNMNIKLTVNDFIARAVALALQSYPIMNSRLINHEIHYNKEIHLGIAVSLESGLIVPVIRNAEKLTLRGLSEKIKSLGERARKNDLDLGEIIGSTFSITNLGKSGVEYFTPVLNPPETGILGVGSMYQSPEFDKEGRVVSKELLPLSLTFDHRVTDGKPASEFLARIKYLLKNPLMILL
jgi:pyruvate dehydrogenase E2 component (dihydrolipoamide acetyltransferase)